MESEDESVLTATAAATTVAEGVAMDVLHSMHDDPADVAVAVVANSNTTSCTKCHGPIVHIHVPFNISTYSCMQHVFVQVLFH